MSKRLDRGRRRVFMAEISRASLHVELEVSSVFAFAFIYYGQRQIDR